MKYYALLRPHANSRYRAGEMKLARAELAALLCKAGVSCAVGEEEIASVRWLTFETEILSPARLDALAASAHLYLLFEPAGDGALKPLAAQRPAWVGEDLPAVLKYRGKTNETFTAFLVNMALCASDYALNDELTLLDPMCGRGTTLFAAANLGFHARGFDRDQSAIDEGEKYFARYLEYHRVKHGEKKVSMTLNGRQAALIREFTYRPPFAPDGARTDRKLSFSALDAQELASIYRKPFCHIIACDLPYGVQHAPSGHGKKGVRLDDLLFDMMPGWVDLLYTGGAVALSFNVNTLPAETVRGILASSGLDVAGGESYQGLEHWVEQAITRDIAVAVKRF